MRFGITPNRQDLATGAAVLVVAIVAALCFAGVPNQAVANPLDAQDGFVAQQVQHYIGADGTDATNAAKAIQEDKAQIVTPGTDLQEGATHDDAVGVNVADCKKTQDTGVKKAEDNDAAKKGRDNGKTTVQTEGVNNAAGIHCINPVVTTNTEGNGEEIDNGKKRTQDTAETGPLASINGGVQCDAVPLP